MSERHGDRPDTPATEPAPAVTGKARSDEWVLDRRQGGAPVRRMDEPAHTQSSSGLAKGRDQWRVVDTGNTRGGTRKEGRERSGDELAVPLTSRADQLERRPSAQRRDSGPGAERDPRPVEAPSYTIRSNGSGSAPAGVEWVEERPAPTIVGTRRSDQGMIVGRQLPEGEGRNVGGHGWTPSEDGCDDPKGLKGEDWPDRRPATVIAGDPRVFQPGGHHGKGEQSQNAVRVTVEEASILQSFPPDYPWQGSRSKQFQQIGNAVPPLMAKAVLAALTGVEA